LPVYAGAPRPDTWHALITSAVLLLGWGLLLTYSSGVQTGNAGLVAIARSGGIWWFLLPVFFSVSHRLIPFFSSVVLPDYQIIRPDWTLWLMSAGSLVHGTLELLGQEQWTCLVDLPMAVVAAWLSYVWCFRKSFQTRILAMLHMAFAWLSVALALYGLQSLSLPLGRAPLHALVVGYFASMLVAMATRVTLGHSGRPLTADNLAWGIFLMVQAAALLRVLADLPVINAYAAHLYLCSALLWLAAFISWLIKFAPIYWRPQST
ncbi:MAG TPA: NnrS family protein, partial [Methylophilaceae bacterium]|nr:NnrS family protein [Methylophilaceae bacterium]